MKKLISAFLSALMMFGSSIPVAAGPWGGNSSGGGSSFSGCTIGPGISPDNSYILNGETDGTCAWISPPSLGGTVWGGISGTLANQTDLQAAFNGKASASAPVPSTNCSNQFISGISTTGAGTCTTVPYSALSDPPPIPLGWVAQSSCSGFTTANQGCYDTTTGAFCIGTGTKCVFQVGANGPMNFPDIGTPGTLHAGDFWRNGVHIDFSPDGSTTEQIDNQSFTGGTLTSELITIASATGGAGFNLPPGAAPTSPQNGDVWLTSAGLYARINGATVGPFATSAGSLTNPMSASGDTIYGGTSGVPTRLVIGTNGYIYSIVSGLPAWVANAPSLVGLGNVTNDAQTKASIVPNTAPTVGQILLGNNGGTAYVPQTMSGDCTISYGGAINCTKSSGSAFGTAAFQNTSYFLTSVPALGAGNGTSIDLSGAANVGGAANIPLLVTVTQSGGDNSTKGATTAYADNASLPIIESAASNATPTPAVGALGKVIIFKLTAQSVSAAFAGPTGTPFTGQLLEVIITDNGSPSALTWNSSYYVSSGTVTLPTTTVASTALRILFQYSSDLTRWVCIAIS